MQLIDPMISDVWYPSPNWEKSFCFRGVNILKKKPEFQRELERRRESQKKRDWELYKEQKKTLFEKKMEEQANKLKMVTVWLISIGVL